MFGFGKKKKELNPYLQFLEMPDDNFAVNVSEVIDRMDRATRAHTLVAYQNLLPVLGVAYSVSQERNEKFSVEDFMVGVSEKLDQVGGDEIASRRWSWLMFACLVARIEKLAFRSVFADTAGVKIWCHLANDCGLLKTLLPSNIVWKDEEKEWFDLKLSEKELIQYVINHCMPPRFSKSEAVKKMALDHELFYYPSQTRVGFVP